MFLNTPQCNRLAFFLLTFWVTEGYLLLWHVFVAIESRNSFFLCLFLHQKQQALRICKIPGPEALNKTPDILILFINLKPLK